MSGRIQQNSSKITAAAMDSEALAKRVAALVAMLGGTAEGLTPQQKEDVRLELLSMIDGTQTPVASSKLIRTQELLDFMICDNM